LITTVAASAATLPDGFDERDALYAADPLRGAWVNAERAYQEMLVVRQLISEFDVHAGLNDDWYHVQWVKSRRVRAVTTLIPRECAFGEPGSLVFLINLCRAIAADGGDVTVEMWAPTAKQASDMATNAVATTRRRRLAARATTDDTAGTTRGTKPLLHKDILVAGLAYRGGGVSPDPAFARTRSELRVGPSRFCRSWANAWLLLHTGKVVCARRGAPLHRARKGWIPVWWSNACRQAGWRCPPPPGMDRRARPAAGW
jgi:hypothetical protein